MASRYSRFIIEKVAHNLVMIHMAHRAYATIERSEVTRELRLAADEPTARLGSNVAEDVEAALLDRGVRCFPALAQKEKNVRLYRADTYAASILDALVYPSAEADRELARMLTKLKGRWKWAEHDHASAA